MSNIIDEPELEEDKPDKKSRNAILGGIGMIIIGTSWFVGGYYLYDEIYFYPFILFFAGIGLITSTLSTGIVK